MSMHETLGTGEGWIARRASTKERESAEGGRVSFFGEEKETFQTW